MKEEIQYFTKSKWFVYMLAAGLFVMAAAGLLQFYAWPMWWVVLIVGAPLFIVGLILWLVFRKARLTTRVDQNGISIQWLPGMKEPRHFPWSSIRHLEVVDSPRPGFAGNKYTLGYQIISMMSRKAAKLELENGKTLYIGTNMPEIWRKN